MNKEAKINVAGRRGLVGFAILTGLLGERDPNILIRIRLELDLRDRGELISFFQSVHKGRGTFYMKIGTHE